MLIITITFISLISIFFCTQIIFEFLTQKDKIFFYVSKSLAAEHLSLMQANPKVTGLSRMILLIFFLFYFINISERKSKFIKYFSFTILFICIFFIYGMQSRGSWIGIFLLFFMNIFFSKERFKKEIFPFILLIFLPIVAFHLIIEIKNYNFLSQIFSSQIKETILSKENTVLESKENTISVENQSRLASNFSSSGRLEIWENILLIAIEEKIILGKGPQADRYLLTKLFLKKLNKIPDLLTVFDNNASNAMLYFYLCAGIFGLLAIIFIYANSTMMIYKNVFIKKNFFKNNILHNFSIVTLSYLLIRSIFENSFSIFSIDFVFFILCYFIISERNDKFIKKINQPSVINIK